MLTNEKYMGDALLQKTYTVDFLSKKRVVNDGIVKNTTYMIIMKRLYPKKFFMQYKGKERSVQVSIRLQSAEGEKRRYRDILQDLCWPILRYVESVDNLIEG